MRGSLVGRMSISEFAPEIAEGLLLNGLDLHKDEMMRNEIRWMMLPAVCLIGLAGQLPAATTRIEGDTNWAGDKTLDDKVVVAKGTLMIDPGVRVTFKVGSEINIRPGAAMVARGTEAKPIEFIGGPNAGIILNDNGTILLDRCRLSDMAGQWSNRPTFLWAHCGKGSTALRNCTISDCGGGWVTVGDGPFEMTGCDIRRRDKLFVGDGGVLMLGGNTAQITITANTIRNVPLSAASGNAEVIIRGNVFVACGPAGFSAPKTLVEENYVHQPLLNSSFGFLNLKGTIRNNVVRGGTWTTSALGGLITGNVLEAMSPEEIQRSAEAGFKDTCTHENLAGVQAGSTVERNIILNRTYGAFMGAAANTCSDCLLRNNTFDLRGRTAPVWLNHLVKVKPKNLVIRNNLFLRTGRMYDETGIPDSIAYTDYNLWAGTDTKAPSAAATWTSSRFVRITLTGKKEGDDDFGAHDVFTASVDDKSFDPKAIVEDPEFVFPFSDEEMLARKHTVKECLDLYRRAYTLKTGCPAIDAGSPEDAKDPQVKDGKCDIGAVEYITQMRQPATSSAPSKK